MLEYGGWGSNPSPMICSVDDLTHDSPHPHSINVDHYAGPGHHSAYGSHLLPTGGGAAAFSPFYGQQPTPGSFQPLYDSRSYGAPSYSTAPDATFSLDSFHGGADSFLVPVPKTEEVVVARPPAVDWLNLGTGGRTYFSSAEDDIISRLYRRSRQLEPSGGGVKVPRCQAEGCNADLTHAKHYHRRHKVCEFHSKAAAVMAAGQTQRFCQQCSRFHLLSEFDNGKRSCRKRLADHNRRRRKSQLPNNPEIQKPHVGRSPTINSLAKSPQESAADQSSSSVTVAAASPPRMSLDCFRQSQPAANYHHQSAASASSSSVSSRSLFFSTSTNY